MAEAIAKGGYSKDKMRQYLYDHSMTTAKRIEQQRLGQLSLCQRVASGELAAEYCESTDPDRLVHAVLSPGNFLITISGDPGRDHCLIYSQSGAAGSLVSKKIELPANWKQLSKG